MIQDVHLITSPRVNEFERSLRFIAIFMSAQHLPHLLHLPSRTHLFLKGFFMAFNMKLSAITNARTSFLIMAIL